MNIESTRRIMREKIEQTYEDSCSVYEQTDVFDKKTKVKKGKKVAILEDEPCRLSFSRLEAGEKADPASAPSQTAKLFISPDIDIKTGCVLEIKHKGRTYEYERSGQPAVYSSHQEIVLQLRERWS